ncbi:MAG TPA: transcriptional regulator [Salinimicrobium sp.]|nr:transcriptional regulator [Salinimicrobium sp.]
MEIRTIKSEEAYQKALKRIDELIDCKENSTEEEELEIISLLVWDYEEKHFPIDNVHPIDSILLRMEELNLKQTDLVNIIGDKSRVSDVLSKKRKLTLKMIRNLNDTLKIPIETLIQDY